jgi:hypothetical protein
MNPREHRDALRQHLVELSGEADFGLARRYALRPLPWETPNPYRRVRRVIGRVLRLLGLRSGPPLEPWLTELNHVDYCEAPRPILIWALGIDRDTLRRACDRFIELQAASPGWAPVLVTDVADFAYFSRLNWLVEYVPTLSAPAEGYFDRKLRYLAWRYRNAPALPATLKWDGVARIEELLNE